VVLLQGAREGLQGEDERPDDVKYFKYGKPNLKKLRADFCKKIDFWLKELGASSLSQRAPRALEALHIHI
jgi:hypothetical protein